jgi:signal transduction histidine kinase
MIGSTIHLLISDQGVGFDPRYLKMQEGLGVRSMAERAHLLGGHFEIRSAAGKGTIIDVRVPLPPESAGRIA